MKKNKELKTWPCDHIFDGGGNMWVARTPMGTTLDVPSWCTICRFCQAHRPNRFATKHIGLFIVSEHCALGNCGSCKFEKCECPNCWCSDNIDTTMGEE